MSYGKNRRKKGFAQTLEIQNANIGKKFSFDAFINFRSEMSVVRVIEGLRAGLATEVAGVCGGNLYLTRKSQGAYQFHLTADSVESAVEFSSDIRIRGHRHLSFTRRITNRILKKHSEIRMAKSSKNSWSEDVGLFSRTRIKTRIFLKYAQKRREKFFD